MSVKTEFRLDVPNPRDLCCLNCQISPADVEYSAIQSELHCQALTCRLLVHSEKLCIATPSISKSSTFHVIANKRYYSSGLLQERLCSMKIKFSEPEYVKAEIYEACLKFTFDFKIAPTWILVGESFYLNGSNFLSTMNNVDVISWKVLVKGIETTLELRPMKMNLFSVTLDSLELPADVVNNFKTSSDKSADSLNLTLFHCPWVYVLPNFTKARVTSVSKRMPINCTFDSYEDLRLHWKNMYSFALPENESEMLFYEVVFPKYLSKRFIYPEICILSKKPETFDHDNRNEICLKFIEDFYKSILSVCGEELKLYPHGISKAMETESNEEGNNEGQKNAKSLVTVNLPNLYMSKAERLLARNRAKHFIADTQNFSDDSLEDQYYVDDIKEIYSFYDIPSMRPKQAQAIGAERRAGKKSKGNQSSVNIESLLSTDSSSNDDKVPPALKAIETSSHKEAKKSKQKPSRPVVTQMENVSFDLAGFRKIRTIHKLDKPAVLQQGKLKKVRQTGRRQGSQETEHYVPPSTLDSLNKFQTENPGIIDFQMKPPSNEHRHSIKSRSRSPLSLDSLDSNSEVDARNKKASLPAESGDSEQHNSAKDETESCGLLRTKFSSFTTNSQQNDEQSPKKTSFDEKSSHGSSSTKKHSRSYSRLPLLKTKLMMSKDEENETSFFSDGSLRLSPIRTQNNSKAQGELDHTPEEDEML